MISSLTVIALCIYNAKSDTYASMTCDWDGSYSGYKDDFDAKKNYYFLSGQKSYFKSKTLNTEDRLFKWEWCRPSSDSNPFESTTSLSQTSYKSDFTRSCGTNAAMYRAKSNYKGWFKEDRKWDFYCATLDDTKFVLDDCAWSGYVFGWQDTISYQCPDDGVITGIQTNWKSSKDDRTWNFECCRIKEITYPALTCVQDEDYVDNWVGDEPTDTRPSYFVTGQEFFVNAQGNTQMRWSYCDMVDDYDAIVSVSDLSDAVEDTSWSASCDHLNDGNAAIIGDTTQPEGGVLKHHTFQCGEIDSEYSLVECEEHDATAGSTEETTDFSCPDNGVFRKIMVGEDDEGNNIWGFECCRIEDSVNLSSSYYPPRYYPSQYVVSALPALGVLLCLLLVVNIALAVRSWCSGRSNKARYKVVSTQSTDDEI